MRDRGLSNKGHSMDNDVDLKAYFRARKAAWKCTRRGQLDEAAKWLRIAERELRVSAYFEEVCDANDERMHEADERIWQRQEQERKAREKAASDKARAEMRAKYG
jgi:hypothetical protein